MARVMGGGHKLYSKNIFINGVNYVTPENRYWGGMMSRCNGKSSTIKRPNYLRCSVSGNFKDFQYFAEWCQHQVGFNSLDSDGHKWCLDKDLLFKGNNVYSEEACIFIPLEINSFLVASKKTRGLYPLGVCFHKRTQKYMAQCCTGRTTSYLGIYSTPEEAFRKYKTVKEEQALKLAAKYENIVGRRAYEALRDFTVDIGD